MLLFSDGDEALHYFKKIQNRPNCLPDVIFLDMKMPIMDGWGFLEEYTALQSPNEQKTVLYIISPSVNDKDLARARRISEMSNYIVKPITGTALIKILSNLKKVRHSYALGDGTTPIA